MSVKFQTMVRYILWLVSLVTLVSALQLNDQLVHEADSAVQEQSQVIHKLDPVRYHYVEDADGNTHLVDLWMKDSDLEQMARFHPDSQNQYLLFTRNNPSVSQPIVFGDAASLSGSNFSAQRRTIVLIHGWRNSATSEIFSVLVPAFLSAENVNVIVVDWSAGADTLDYLVALGNTVTSGQSVARFLTWLNSASGASLSSYHIAGHSLGGHQSGIVGRNLDNQVPYITALDPAMLGWILNSEAFRASDGGYTEVIHTNGGALGYLTPLGDVDFYPNGGAVMTGCATECCNHSRSYYYFGESIASGGFTGVQCLSYIEALTGDCNLSGRLQMGGVRPKTGQTGVYYLETNASPPFSRG